MLAGCSQKTDERWTAPDNPNPQAILHEAQQDASANKYENALAKQVWFHENALDIAPALYGVRLSYALDSWVELGKAFPPALEKLESIRDEDITRIRQGKASRDLFHDFESINDHLGEEVKTKEIFIWLDENNPSFAKLVFDLAEPSLVNAKEYYLCGKYLDPDASFKLMLNSYRTNKELSKQPRFGERLLNFGQKSFSNGVATLVALLTVNGRNDEADRIAASALDEWNDPQFKALLDEAKNGEVPEPWP